MKLVACLRVSSTGQLDGYGLDAQRRDITLWAKAHGHRLISWHHDVVSGTVDAADRPGLSAALLDLVRAEGLIVARLDRLARQVTTQEAILAAVWRQGYQVFAADQGEVVKDDPDDPMRTAMRLMMGVFAQVDRMLIVKRLRDGREAKAATGKKATGSYAFGYKGHGRGRDRDLCLTRSSREPRLGSWSFASPAPPAALSRPRWTWRAESPGGPGSVLAGFGAGGYVIYEQQKQIDELTGTVQSLDQASRGNARSADVDTLRQETAEALQATLTRLEGLETQVGDDLFSPAFPGDGLEDRLADVERDLRNAQQRVSQACSALLLAGVMPGC
ncbi:recombinase family protein [Jiangella endophytica]|uniref:recombinase family protein n=1 Tax=Jiangella endophytica TaxID=1623398 RepID=UPI000E35405A|nr:recombinase family protein [Jiangella endophytica]